MSQEDLDQQLHSVKNYMTTAHRIADGFRSVISYWTPTPTKSQFVEKGILTPQEFVEAGDQLAFKFPTWKWEKADTRRQVGWLPPSKQYLATYGVSCRCRVKDLEKCYLQAWKTTANEIWLIPSPPSGITGSEEVVDESEVAETDFESKHSTSVGSFPKLPEFPSESKQKTWSNTSSVICFSELDDILNAEEDGAAVNGLNAHSSPSDKVKVRSYDLSITYDKYYQTPRLWLKGYNQSGVPLWPSEIFEDILTDYVSKTVTIEPHPCTGESTVSIHPCKHAAVMKKVVNGWILNGLSPRHDLALVVLLKFISSVIPTIQYDTTIDIYGFSLAK